MGFLIFLFVSIGISFFTFSFDRGFYLCHTGFDTLYIFYCVLAK